MLTVKELYDFLHEKGIKDVEIDLVFRYADETRSYDFKHDKEQIQKTWNDCEIEGIDIYCKD